MQSFRCSLLCFAFFYSMAVASAQTPSIGSVVNGATLQAGGLAPGDEASVLGTNFAEWGFR